MREQYKHMLNFMANLISISLDVVLFAWIWYGFYAKWITKTGLAVAFHQRGHWAVIAIYILFIFFFTQVFGGYKIGYMRLTDIVLSNVLALVLSNIVAYFELCLVCRDYVDPIPLIGCAAGEMIFSLVWNFMVREAYKALYPPRQMLLIHGRYAPDDLISKINSRADKYNICATMSYETDVVELYNTMAKYNAVVLYDLPDEFRNQLIKYCYIVSKRVYVIPKISDIIFQGADDIHLFDTPLLLMRNQGLTIDQRIIKRISDIVISLIGIVVASPFMLLIALAIKLYDGGPVIYKQQRLTRDGEVFEILKFRSMSVGSEKKQQITAKNDSRVTPVGRIIRAIHFDELPQLFNILIGQMSVVGPRPEWRVTTEKYMSEIPEFRFRLKVKAGLTGYAQVFGKYNTTPLDKLKLDMTYIENYSLWMDIKILMLTVKVLFMKENTEGIDSNQKTALKSDSSPKEASQQDDGEARPEKAKE